MESLLKPLSRCALGLIVALAFAGRPEAPLRAATESGVAGVEVPASGAEGSATSAAGGAGPRSDAFIAHTSESIVKARMTLRRAPTRVAGSAGAAAVLDAAFPSGWGARAHTTEERDAAGASPFGQFAGESLRKLDRSLQLVVSGAPVARPIGAGAEGPPGELAVLTPESGSALVRVLVETSDVAAAARGGLRVRSAAGSIATGVVRARDLDDVAALASTRRISTPREWKALNDLGRNDVGVPGALADYGTDGEGVLVAVLDSGLDFEHPSFRNRDGSTRVSGVLDFAFPGDVDADGDIDGAVAGGTVFTKAEIDAALEFGNGWEDRAVNGTVTAGELASFPFDVDYRTPVNVLHTQLHIQGDLTAIDVALNDPDGWVYTLDLSAAATTNLQATYVIPIDAGANIDGEWRLVIQNSGQEDASVLSWAFFADRRVFLEDLNGHGTHVTGTAAGNGRTSDGPSLYTGIAPEADILFVRGERTLNGFATDDIVAGMHWTDATAAALRQPYALNMSLGAAIGPHDGTEPEDKAIDGIVGPGRQGKAIVVANGNNGDTAMHAGGSLAAGGDAIPLEVVVPTDADGVSYTWVYLAVEGTGVPRFGLEHPFPDELTCVTYVFNGAGEGVEPRQDCDAMDRFGPGSPLMFELRDVDQTSATVGTLVWEQGDRAHLISIDWYDTESYWVMPGPWGLTVRGLAGGWDGWQTDCTPLVDCDNLMTVGSPAASERAISVGSYNTRVVWTDFRGERHEVDEGLGELSSFSSRGPTRDGRVKPEITAPGQKIISARSNDRALCPYVHPLYCQAPELGWPDDVSYELLALQGTSMATPIVTGAAALLLQMDWRLDAEEIKGILMATARTDGSTGVRPDPDDWGAGKLDVRGAARRVEEMSAPTPVASPSPRPRASPSPSRSPGQRYGIFVPVAARGAIQ